MQNKFNPIVESIFLLKCLYILSFPLAKTLAKYKFNPNTITTISNMLVICSIYFLFIKNVIFFIILWIAAEIFDICDGTVARINNMASESGAFYDHFSDQIKIFLFFISISLYFQSTFVTYLAFVSACINLLYVDVSLRTEIFKLKHHTKIQKLTPKSKSKTFLRQIYNHVFLIHGHTMVILPFFVVNIDIAITGLSLFILVALKNLLGSLRAQVRVLRKI